MPDLGDAFFGALPTAGDEGICGDIDICSSGVLMCEPSEITRLKRALKRLDD